MNQAKSALCSNIRRRHVNGDYIRGNQWRGYEEDERPSWDKRVQRHANKLRHNSNKG